jgi:hypothetical protein
MDFCIMHRGQHIDDAIIAIAFHLTDRRAALCVAHPSAGGAPVSASNGISLNAEGAFEHWEAASALSERCPALSVSSELFEIDGRRSVRIRVVVALFTQLPGTLRQHGAIAPSPACHSATARCRF